MNEQMNEQDKMLWKKAKARVGFRRHLFVYIIVNAFVWAMYFIRYDAWNMDMNMNDNDNMMHGHHFHVHGPIFMTLGWGIGLAFHFYGAYYGNRYDSVQKEYEKLKNSGK